MLEYKIVNAKDKDIDILTSIKLVTMIDDEMDKALSYNDKNKIKKNIVNSIERGISDYKIIYIGKRIGGAYSVIPYDDGFMIDEIFLFEEYRNRGICTEIINKMKKKCPILYIWVYCNNKSAIRLFKRLGFIMINKGRTCIMKCDLVYVSIKDKLHSIKLGYRDKDGKFYSGFRWNFKDLFYLQSPKQLLESRIGTCFEQVELERELISKMGVDLRTYFIHYPDDMYDYAHAFLIYKDKKKYYWVENAWLKYKGLHIYDNKEELFNDVLFKFIKTIPEGEFKKVKLYMYEKPRFGINYVKYLTHCINGKSMKVK